MKKKELIKSGSNIAVIVAHPDDETLWCGGTILENPYSDWFVACLCRKNDSDRAPKFQKVLNILQAPGKMGDLDDGPDQLPLAMKEVKKAILELLPPEKFDLIITHNPSGEYTRHKRHEEVSRAVIELWREDKIRTAVLWTFAYEDGNKQYLPRRQVSASIQIKLKEETYDLKYKIITEVYGFPLDGFEALTTPREEAFWKFDTSLAAFNWLKKQ